MTCADSQPKEEVEETSTLDETSDDLSSSVANVCDPEKYQEVFQARHRLSELISSVYYRVVWHDEVRLRAILLTNHPLSVLWHCWLGYQTCKNIASEMT